MKRRLLIALAIGSAGLATAQRVGTPTDDLSNLSVDDLFRLEVTSVGRKAQELAKAPAAIYVLTAEDIRRSGAASIPEALLGVPGLTVQQVAGNMWAVSARGFARPYSDKMLVMIDGRSLYTPLFSGVLWDMTDVPLENIERIEIIRGPGAVMWGPNAVNGVINIITKSARDTQGALVSVESGNEIHGSVFARWGAAPSKRFAYQVWAKLEDENPAGSSFGWYRFDLRDPNRTPTPLADLNSQSARLGFRMEGQIAGRDELMVQGDLFKMGSRGAMGYPAPQPYSQDVRFEHTGGMGGFLQVRWTRAEAAGNESSLQFTYDKQAIDYPYLGGKMANLTVDFQKRLQTSDRNEVYWGGGFQHYSDSTYSSHFVAFDPPTGAYCLADAVLRDEFQLIPNRLLVSAGVRADYTTYGKFDLQPSVRFLYTPNARQSVWLALSRAVRVP
ncbi:MAG TPA: TonB-dependent receptor plug domain-containing protein, partial [Bryobacteraceae bacterium]